MWLSATDPNVPSLLPTRDNIMITCYAQLLIYRISKCDITNEAMGEMATMMPIMESLEQLEYARMSLMCRHTTY